MLKQKREKVVATRLANLKKILGWVKMWNEWESMGMFLIKVIIK